jgi:hypothetical protein
LSSATVALSTSVRSAICNAFSYDIVETSGAEMNRDIARRMRHSCAAHTVIRGCDGRCPRPRLYCGFSRTRPPSGRR